MNLFDFFCQLNNSNYSYSFALGFATLITACAIGAYKFKQRGDMPVSIYLMQFRVLAQTSVIGCITAGMLYHMFNKHVLHKEKEE